MTYCIKREINYFHTFKTFRSYKSISFLLYNQHCTLIIFTLFKLFVLINLFPFFYTINFLQWVDLKKRNGPLLKEGMGKNVIIGELCDIIICGHCFCYSLHNENICKSLKYLTNGFDVFKGYMYWPNYNRPITPPTTSLTWDNSIHNCDPLQSQVLYVHCFTEINVNCK